MAWGALSSGAAFAVPLLGYVATLAPGVDFWDTGEMQTVPYVLGIAHPTGFPLYVLLGWAFSHALPFGDVAWRLSLFAALASATTTWLLFRFVADETQDAAVGLAAALSFAAGDIVWVHATRADEHDLALAFTTLALVLGARAGRAAAPRQLVYAALALGCGLAVHPVALLALPAVAVLAWPAIARAGLAGNLRALVACALPLACYAYVPLRSAYVEAHGLDPGASAGLHGGAILDYDAPSNPAAFWAYVTGATFQPGAAFARAASGAGVARALAFARDVLYREYGYAMLTFALVGAGTLLVKRRRMALAFALLWTCALAFIPNYRVEADPARYALCALWTVSACAAFGAEWFVRALAGERSRAVSALAAACLLVALWPNERAAWSDVHRELAFQDAGNLATIVAAQTDDGSLVIAAWTFATPLAYAAYVKRSLGARVIVSGWPHDFAGRYPAWQARFKHVYFVVPATYPVAAFGTRLAGENRWQLAEMK